MRLEPDEPVSYFFRTDREETLLNEALGCPFSLIFSGTIYCVVCGRKTSKAFGQGFCFPCFRDSPENSPCIVRPELCRGHLGEGRDVQWELENHVTPHIVYLAWSSGWKVGVTRESQVPVRWLDQGASLAIPIARTPNRYEAGLIEVALKQHLADKTDWRHMLLAAQPPRDCQPPLNPDRFVPEASRPFLLAERPCYRFSYPLIQHFAKVVSVNLSKTPHFEGTLAGMKGQYLILSDGRVLNIRNHLGFEVEVRWAF
jgi:hypothetical protein